jgi:hypothetical protein
MQSVTRREFMAIAATAVMLGGCAASQPTQPTQPAQSGPADASVGDELDVSTKSGDVRVTVDGFEMSQSLTKEFQDYTQIDADHACGVLMLTLENVSYESKSLVSNELGDCVDLNDVLRVKDGDGVSLDPMSTGDDYGDYESSAGGIIDCAKGEKVRVAVCYSVNPSLASVDVETADGASSVHVEITQA